MRTHVEVFCDDVVLTCADSKCLQTFLMLHLMSNEMKETKMKACIMKTGCLTKFYMAFYYND